MNSTRCERSDAPHRNFFPARRDGVVSGNRRSDSRSILTSDPQPQPSGPAAKISGLFPDAAPTVAAFLAFLTGAATIISAANPGIHPRAVDALSLIAVEAPSMIAALVGIGQMALADGLRRRIDASMW